jgi:hypothetical protein
VSRATVAAALIAIVATIGVLAACPRVTSWLYGAPRSVVCIPLVSLPSDGG